MTRTLDVRALTAVLGGLALLNLLVERWIPGFSVNGWWVDLRWLPAAPRAALLLVGGLGLLATAWAARPGARLAAAVGVGLLLAAVVFDVARFYQLRAAGLIDAGPLPLSLGVALVLGAGLWALARPRVAPPVWPAFVVALGGLAVAAPLLMQLSFGRTDYRRPADAAVVFGARAYADGTPSPALADRVRTACRLYHEGLVGQLILSGGPGDGDVHETESMRRMARRLGVPDAALLLDPDGLSTRATIAGSLEVARRRGVRRLLAVSHFYHLTRIKLAYQHAGWDVRTVPADHRRQPTHLVWQVAREVPAIWWYYLAPLRG